MSAIIATYKLEIDWNNDGDYGDAGEDCTSDFVSATITRGYSSPLARVPSVGRANFLLNNHDKQYSPALEANVRPRRPVQFTMTYDATPVVLFLGYIESVTPTWGRHGARQVSISCVDAISLLDLESGAGAMLTAVYADDVIEAVVDAVYTPASDSYQVGLNYFPTSGDWNSQDQEQSASKRILDACVSDWGRFYIAKDGTPTFVNRHQMPLDDSTELTLSSDMLGLSYQMAADQIYNQIEVTCYPRTVGTVNEAIGRISQQSAPSIEASDDAVFVINFRDPSNKESAIGGKDPIEPVATTDFICTEDPEGEGAEVANVTASATFYSDRAEVTLTNANAFVVYVQKLQVRGLAVRSREKVTMVAADGTSQTAYQRRRLTVDCPLMSHPGDAQLLADYLLSVYKDPRDDLRNIKIIANTTVAMMAAVRDLELIDKVVVTETQTGVSSWAGHIYSMQHNIKNRYFHELTFSLEQAPSLGTPFRLDTSALNSGHVLIY